MKNKIVVYSIVLLLILLVFGLVIINFPVRFINGKSLMTAVCQLPEKPKSILLGLFPVYRKIEITNEDPNLVFSFNKDKFACFLADNKIIPGKNCFFLGRDKGVCFSNNKVKIRFSPKEDIENAITKVDFGEEKKFIYSIQEGSDRELEIVFNLVNTERVDKDIIQNLINKAINDTLTSDIYKEYDLKQYTILREKAKTFWEQTRSKEDYFFTLL